MNYFGPFEAARRRIAEARERARQWSFDTEFFLHPDLADQDLFEAYWYVRDEAV